MIGITNHGYDRYCERVLEIKVCDIKNYIAENREGLTLEIQSKFDKSKFIYFGKYNDQPKANYYVYENLMLVANDQNQAIMSVYFISFDFGEEMDMIIIKDLIKQIDEHGEKVEKLNEQHDEELSSIQFEIDKIGIELSFLQEQMDLYKKSLSYLENDKTRITCEKTLNQSIIHRLASKLCYSINYKISGLTKK